MDHCVFIHTNHKQMVGALVAKYALKRNSPNADRFDVQIIDTADYPWLQEHEGQMYLRDTVRRVWLNDDLQSFTPLRFMPPKLMNYQGRAIVIDPDIFAVGDVRAGSVKRVASAVGEGSVVISKVWEHVHA